MTDLPLFAIFNPTSITRGDITMTAARNVVVFIFLAVIAGVPLGFAIRTPPESEPNQPLVEVGIDGARDSNPCDCQVDDASSTTKEEQAAAARPGEKLNTTTAQEASTQAKLDKALAKLAKAQAKIRWMQARREIF